jgi:hypothetical protein
VSGYALVVGPVTTLNAGSGGSATATCATGKKPLGGGWLTAPSVTVDYSGPDGFTTEWIVTQRGHEGDRHRSAVAMTMSNTSPIAPPVRQWSVA